MATIAAVFIVVLVGAFFITAFTGEKTKKEQPVKQPSVVHNKIFELKKQPDTTTTFKIQSLIGNYNKAVAKTKDAAKEVNKNTYNYKRVIDSLTLLLEPVPDLVTH